MWFENVAKIPNLNTTWIAPLVYQMVKVVKPLLILETGWWHGYMTAWLCKAAEEVGSEVITIDNGVASESPTVIKTRLATCGINKQPTFILKDAIAGIRELIEQQELKDRLGFVVIDDLHTCDHVLAEFNLLWPYIVNGGIFSGHDVFGSDSPGVHDAFRAIEQLTQNRMLWFKGPGGFAFVQKIASLGALW